MTAGGEQGLLSLAFAPDYARSGRFYVYFTDRAGDQRVVEYRRASRRRAPTPARRGSCCGWPTTRATTTAGCCCSAPTSTSTSAPATAAAAGDQHGARGNAQNLGSLLGKLLRIDPAAAGGRPYSVPSDNPFVGRDGARGEIYSYGLRNPWRYSFDRRTGDLSIGDVGQNEVEEIDFVRRGKGRGANFGWRPFEGRSRYAPGESAPGHVPPVITRSHGAGLVLDHRRRRGPRPAAAGAARALRVRRLLRGATSSRRACRAGRARSVRATPLQRRQPLLVRGGRARPRLRDVARAARSTGSSPR